MNLNVSESMFKKPLPLMLDNYFEYHPLQPVSHTFFNCKKVFYKADGTNRFWLTFDGKSLFCTVCLAFGSKNNSFVLGMNTWSHTYQRIQENENILEHNASIEAYFLHVHKTNIDNLLFVNQLNSRKILIKQRLNALERIIDVVKLIGKRSLSYRGKHNEAAYTLHNDSIDHGNFLDILLLLKKYDVVLHEYLDNIIKKSQVSHNSGNKTRGGLLTLISKTTVNQIIECISDLIKKYIASQIVEAEMFSVELDTTQDVAVKDQCAIVIRYVNSNGIHEKLIAVVNCIDSSGKGIFKLLSNVLTNNNLNIKYCIANATDGAASMQGIYNGFSKWLSDESPGNVHVWCYSHILNLVLSDITKTSIATASVFSLLNGLAAFFKESYQRMAVWSKATRSDVKHRKLQLIGETRWWAKEEALNKIFGSIKSTDCLYIELLISLYEIETSEHFSIEIRSKAKNFKESMLKYSTLLTAFMYLRIYKITSPLSKYLQTSGIDLHKSQQLVDIAHKELQHIKRDVKGLKKQVDAFIINANNKLESFIDEIEEELDITIETELPKLRLRKKKKAFEELTEDDPIVDPFKKFTVEIYNNVMDKVVESMEKRFIKNNQIYMDLACLSPIHFYDFNNGLPPNSLSALAIKLKTFNKDITLDSLQSELLHFASSWNKLKISLPESYIDNDISEDDENQDDDLNIFKKSCNEKKLCKNCAVCCFNVLMKYKLYSDAYQQLTLAYKYLLTLPSTQVIF